MNILIILAAVFLVAAIFVGSISESTWKNCAITWALLLIGAALLGITLTL